MTLFTYFRSSTSWRVRIVLNYKGIPHDFKFVHLVKGEQKSEQYKKINPNGVLRLSYRQYHPWFFQMVKFWLSQWRSVNIYKRHIMNIHCYRKILLEERRLEDFVKLLTQECNLIKIWECFRKFILMAKLTRRNLQEIGFWGLWTHWRF